MQSTYVLGTAEGNAGDAVDTDQVQLLDGLASLLLVTGVDDGGRAGREVGLLLAIGVGAAVIIVLVDGGLLGLLVGKLFDSRVGHFEGLLRGGAVG